MIGLSTRANFSPPDPVSPRAHYEARLAALEGGGRDGGARGYAFSSPEAAISAVLDLVESGAHVILSGDLHGPTSQIFENLRRRTSDLRLSHVDAGDEAGFARALLPETRMIWIENPHVPAFGRVDLGRVAAFARAHELISVCDNGRATPIFQRPLEEGFDLAVYGMSGYLHGGTGAGIGAATVALDQVLLADKLDFVRRMSGTVPADYACERAASGLASVALRMARVADNMARVSAFLAAHSRCLEVLPEPGAACLGGAVSVLLASPGAEVRASLERLALIEVTANPDGLRSTAEHPASMSYAPILEEIRNAFGAVDGLVLFHLGIEDGDDLIADIRQAFGD